jgi:predicted DNA-binding protein
VLHFKCGPKDKLIEPVMIAKNPRINVTFEKTSANLLSDLAHQENKSVASLVRELVLEALEMREDLYLSKVAEKLDKEGAKTYPHDDAWE